MSLNNKRIRVLVVDDSIVFREAIIRGIGSDSGIEVVGGAGDPYAARDKIEELEPDVVTLDVEMPRMNGIEFLKKLMPQYPLPVVVVSAVDNCVFDALNAGAVDFVAKPDASDPGRKAAEAWIEKNRIDRTKITKEERSRFLAYVGERYFSIVSRAIKKHDPNHLFLGSRFHSSEKHDQNFMRAVGKYIDIVSINYYSRWTPVREEMDDWVRWTSKPFIITEWYVKAEDSGLPNSTGAGWIVKTQKDRGLFYQNYALALLESRGCIGWHWFKYQDNDPDQKDAEPSNIDSNKGMVDSYYNPYADLISAMKPLNLNAYALIEYFDMKSGGNDVQKR
ncbi:MAG: response regulator [Clostridiales bacterium]|nr:response regulator [Clostridiales bacterium]